MHSSRPVARGIELGLGTDKCVGLLRLGVNDGRGAEGLVVLQRGILKDGPVGDDDKGGDAPVQRADA
eukprot:CAMPEP_0171170340 /NCGR_PEP_ID=MMETSP0790-20130122/8664_1 /TAXON_ID=2925 /ORGANISM="Alexandrium catenella, Strain OF101" /LENGTH=66 /DNA_ID=CAMNT_0011635185 /DNA_START=81 /DNA_END=278 /DNA_ORIENTATION=-